MVDGDGGDVIEDRLGDFVNGVFVGVGGDDQRGLNGDGGNIFGLAFVGLGRDRVGGVVGAVVGIVGTVVGGNGIVVVGGTVTVVGSIVVGRWVWLDCVTVVTGAVTVVPGAVGQMESSGELRASGVSK